MNGKRQGKGKEYCDGILVFDGEFFNGEIKVKSVNLKRYEELKERNQIKIRKEYHCLTGELEYEGQYSNGKRNGIGKKYYKGKLDYIGKYLNDMRNGKWKNMIIVVL